MLRWLRSYWYIPLFIAGAIIGWLLFSKIRGWGNPLAQTMTELEAIRSGAKVRRIEAELGNKQALKHVEDAYKADLSKLDEEQTKEAEKLREDPEALTRFLVRTSSR